MSHGASVFSREISSGEFSKTPNGGIFMSTNKRGTKYDEDFKRTLLTLYQASSKTQAALCKEYGDFQTDLLLDQAILNY